MGCFLYVVIKHKEHFQVSFQLVNSFTDILLHFFLENILSSYYLVYVLDCSSGGRKESTGSCFRSFRGGGGSSCGGSNSSTSSWDGCGCGRCYREPSRSCG